MPVPEFPVRVLPKPIRDYVTAAADSLDAPVDFVAVPLFAVAASIIGRRWVIQLKRGWIERAILIAAVVAEPGTAKSRGSPMPAYHLMNVKRHLPKSTNEAKRSISPTWTPGSRPIAKPVEPRLSHQ